MSKRIETPRITEEMRELAEDGIAEALRLRTQELPKAESLLAQRNKRLLQRAVSFLNRLGIFPTTEILNKVSKAEAVSVHEKLLPIASVVREGGLTTDYYLNPAGEILPYLKLSKHTIAIEAESDWNYIEYTADALAAVESTIREASRSGTRASLRIINGSRTD